MAVGVVEVCLARIASDLREQQINAERRLLVVEERLELVNVLAKHFGRVAHTAHDAEPAGIGHSGGEFGAGHIPARQTRVNPCSWRCRRNEHAGEHLASRALARGCARAQPKTNNRVLNVEQVA